MSSDLESMGGVREAKQARSKKTRDKLIAAFEALLKEKPFEAIGVADIAKRAGCAVGSVYRRFENKDAFVPVLIELTAARMSERMREMGPIRLRSDSDLEADLKEIARRTWAVLEAEAHLLRLAHARSGGDNPVCDAAVPAMMEGVRQAVEAALRQRAPARAEAERKRAARWAAYLMVTPMMEKALFPDRSPADFLEAGGEEVGRVTAELIAGRLS